MSGRILVLGDFRQTVTVVRSLARAGFRITLGCDDPRSSTALSRYVSDLWIYDWSSSERFYDQLEAYLRSEKPDFVFTVGERLLRRLIKAAPRFEPLSTWVNPDPATIARCFDKSALYELAPQLGIPTLPWRRFTGADDWRDSARAMGFPVVVKRKDSAAHVQDRKALILDTPAQLDGFLATLPSEPRPEELVLQKYLAGVRHNCHVACADGRLIGYFQQKVLSTDELDDTGIGTAGMSVAPTPELRAHCERLTQALDYTGIGCIQFLVDEAAGTAGFLELNARMDSTAALPYRLGYDYPLLAVELARYRRSQRGRPAGFAPAYAPGKTYYWLYGDLGAWVSARKHRISAAALAAWALRMAWMSLRSHHLTFDWRDPLPTLDMYRQRVARLALRRLQRGARPKPVAAEVSLVKPSGG
jgi:predicted ATP-grasp superfamily ATP-dependent carboligase